MTDQLPMRAESGMTPADWAELAPNAVDKPYGRIDVGDGHMIHAEEFGNPNGEPVLIIHGGPGGGCDAVYARYINNNPELEGKRVIMYDQRGCGHSTPTVVSDLKGGMHENNTFKLSEDINKVREHFGIEGKMHILGGSWGTTLGLYYAEHYPQNVKSMVLRGLFLGTQRGMDYLFQGNAATYEEAPETLLEQLSAYDGTYANLKANGQELSSHIKYEWARRRSQLTRHLDAQDDSIEGAYRAFMKEGGKGQIGAEYVEKLPHMKDAYARAWDEFVRVIPKEERGNMAAAYCKYLEMEATTPDEIALQQRRAFAFAKWEGLISRFNHKPDPVTGGIDLGKFEDPEFALIFSRMEARYMNDGLYLSDDGSPTPGGADYLIDPKRLKAMADEGIDITLITGHGDEVTPKHDAINFKALYEAAGGPEVELILPPESGHSMMEYGNTEAIIRTFNNPNRVKPMNEAERSGDCYMWSTPSPEIAAALSARHGKLTQTPVQTQVQDM